MTWDLEGLRIEAKYMGEFPVVGRVESSRVRYGGEVSHTVVLDDYLVVYNRKTDRVIVEHKYVERVMQ